MKFSIIVPVYNVEKYIHECVESVINQTYTDWELILVDDGSPDNCPIICDEYSESDSRIKVVHKSNGGLSSSRNAGIKHSTGKYLLFLDGDDFWNDINMLSIISNVIDSNSSEIIMFGCTDFNEITGKSIISRTGYELEIINSGDYNKALHNLLSSKMIPGGSTIFTVSSMLIRQIDFLFKEGIQDEDYDYVLSMFLNGKSIFALNNPFYMYRQGRSDSITGTSSIKMIKGIDYTLNKWLPLTEKIENEQIKKDVLNYLAFIYTTGFVVLGRLPKADKKEALEIMKCHKSVLHYGYWRKTKIIRIADLLLGDSLFSFLATKYYKFTHIGV